MMSVIFFAHARSAVAANSEAEVVAIRGTIRERGDIWCFAHGF